MDAPPEWKDAHWPMVLCRVDLAERMFREWKFYQAAGCEHVEGKRARFESYVAEHGTGGIHCPMVRIYRPADRPYQLRFLDGMHRFLVLRDAGVESIPLMMTQKEKRIAAKIGMAGDTP